VGIPIHYQWWQTGIFVHHTFHKPIPLGLNMYHYRTWEFFATIICLFIRFAKARIADTQYVVYPFPSCGDASFKFLEILPFWAAWHYAGSLKLYAANQYSKWQRNPRRCTNKQSLWEGTWHQGISPEVVDKRNDSLWFRFFS
jgi:hypothetical protein